MRLTDYANYADAKIHFSRTALWELVDGSRERLNIAHECIDRHRPERTAVRIAFADGRDEAYTFGEVAAWSSRFAHFLVREGVQAGDRVAIFLEPSLPFYLALFGAMKAGAVAVPMFTLLGSDAVAARIEDCDPVLALAGTPLGGVRTVVADDSFLAALRREPDVFEVDSGAADMAMFQYTSGTTRALPEAVRHRHRAIVTVLIAALYATGVRPGDRFCCPSSPAWGHGLWHGTLGPLALGAEITAWSGRFDPVRMLAVLEDYRITNLSAAATHYRMMKNCGAAGGHRFEIEKLSFTGEPIDSDTAEFAGAHLRERGAQHVRHDGGRGDPRRLSGRRRSPDAAGQPRQADARRRRRDPAAERGDRGHRGRGRNRRPARRRVVSHPGPRPGPTRTAGSTTRGGPTTSSSRPAGR